MLTPQGKRWLRTAPELKPGAWALPAGEKPTVTEADFDEDVAPTVARRAFFTGLDLGQTKDYTAIAVLERTLEGKEATYACRYLYRYPLGTSYVTIAGEVAKLMQRPPLPKSVLVVDQTGVGRPVVDVLRQTAIPATLWPVTITAGAAVVTGADGGLHVPKRQLVSTLQVLLQSGRLKIDASLPHAATLTRELQNFKVKITLAANESFEAWREADHDDMVLALALAAWMAERPKKRFWIL